MECACQRTVEDKSRSGLSEVLDHLDALGHAGTQAHAVADVAELAPVVSEQLAGTDGGVLVTRALD